MHPYFVISHSLVEYLEHTFTLGWGMFCPEIVLKIRKGFCHDENSAVLNIYKRRVKVFMQALASVLGDFK